ncbi:aminopeptidase P family protein [Peribacillus saganii]|uniref:Aminopeptidase P family protein n=1 Tax=Peribacillus saganii TaxID=2303992 RepID=A0A372LL19_9BACI|nr:Xaa-Pro peptidase family protein [Peribacillus saganii]RFU66864.1 aminopeptidase P family protein [Peribacillus saganii]
MSYRKRIEKAQILLKEKNIKAVIATSPSNFFYFTGTWLDSHERLQAVVVTQNGKPSLIVHEMSKEEILPADLFDTYFWKDGESSIELLAKLLPERGSISVDNQWPSQNLLTLMKLTNHLSFVDSTEVIGKLRINKDQHEIAQLKKSGAIADDVMKEAIQFIKPGITEKEVAEEIKRLFASHEVADLSFSPIVGTGKNGAIPHHQSGDTPITEGDMVVIDLGGIKDHYCSDMTRTIYVGSEPPDEIQKVYEIVKCAQAEAVKAVKPGVPLKEIDRIARDIITQEGYGKHFTHRTGHGLGIDVHEEPFVTVNNDQLLEEGMVISVEPGIYLNGRFGVRIEDIVVVTATGCESLNHFTHEMIAKNENAGLTIQ